MAEALREFRSGVFASPGGEREIKPEEIYERVVAQKVPQLDYIYFSELRFVK